MRPCITPLFGLLIFFIGGLRAAESNGTTFNRLPASERTGEGWSVEQTSSPSSFPLVAGSSATPIAVAAGEAEVVKKAAAFYAQDVERLTGVLPKVRTNVDTAPAVLIVGTLGAGGPVDDLATSGCLQVESIRGRWESYQISIIDHPFRGVERALVVAGSDRRGTAYGLLALSEKAGVSPWYWWADITPPRVDALHVHLPALVRDGPSVKYRGIFLNDERFGGLALWAAGNLDRDTANMGPNTYVRIFELMLRLRANYLWPAMHPGTRAFNSYPENAPLAEAYGIVMGSSHCEIMLRDNEYEWHQDRDRGPYNYQVNRVEMVNYWAERLKANGSYENLYTLGLRGVHDTPMEGAVTLQERTRYTQLALDDQQALLRNQYGPNLNQVGQVFCAYKEVLGIYLNGLHVPDEVTLLWADDNNGFIRNLSDEAEQRRCGGSGVYYHLSYHGDPESWLWLSSLSPVLIAEEMGKAYAFGADRIWMFNVGDIKPAEKELSFAMELAWNAERWTVDRSDAFIASWCGRVFGAELGAQVAELLREGYQLAAWGKPEHVWLIDYPSTEREERLARYRHLAERVRRLRREVPARLADAYFELVEYPLVGAELVNELQLSSRRSQLELSAGHADAALASGALKATCLKELDSMTARYNEQVAGGKWRGIMKWKPWQRADSPNYDRAPVADAAAVEQARRAPSPARFSVAAGQREFRWTSDRVGRLPVWFLSTTPGTNNIYEPRGNLWWSLRLNDTVIDGTIRPLGNIWHAVEVGPQWSRVGSIDVHSGANEIEILSSAAGARVDEIVVGETPPCPADALLRLSVDRAVVSGGKQASIRRIQGLGGAGAALAVDPTTAAPIPAERVEEAPKASFEIPVPEGAAWVEIRVLPTQHINRHRSSRFAARLNGGRLAVFDTDSPEFSSAWQRAVLDGYVTRALPCTARPGTTARLEIYFLDPSIVVEEVRIQGSGKLPVAYFLPSMRAP